MNLASPDTSTRPQVNPELEIRSSLQSHAEFTEIGAGGISRHQQSAVRGDRVEILDSPVSGTRTQVLVEKQTKENQSYDDHGGNFRGNGINLVGKFVDNLVDKVASLAIFLDLAIRVLGERIFSLLPRRVQNGLKRLNGEYLDYRNRLLGIGMIHSQCDCPKATGENKLGSTEQDSVGINISSLDDARNNPQFCGASISPQLPNKDAANSQLPNKDAANSQLPNKDAANSQRRRDDLALQRGDVPGWVLVVLMTTGLVTALWTIAAPRLSQILRNSLDSMNGIR